MSKAMVDLALKLSADTAELKRAMRETNTQLSSVKNNTSNIGTQITKAFGTITMAVGTAYGVFKTFEGVLRSNQVTSDALDRAIAGAKNSIEYLMNSVAAADFNNLIQGLNRAKEAAEDFTFEMDEVADRQRALDWQFSEDDVRLAELRVQMRNKNLSVTEKTILAQEAMAITEKQLNDTLKLREMSYNAIYKKIKDTHGLSDNQMNIIENWLKYYDDLGKAEQGRVQTVLTEEGKLAQMRKKYNEEDLDYIRKKRTDPTLTREEYGFTYTEIEIDKQMMLVEFLKGKLGDTEKEWFNTISQFGPRLMDATRDALAQSSIEMYRAMASIINKRSTFMRYMDEGSLSTNTTPTPTPEKTLTELEKLYEDFNKAVEEGNSEMAAEYLVQIQRMEKETKDFLEEVERLAWEIANPLYTRQFDLSNITKPEEEEDDNPPNPPTTEIKNFNDYLKDATNNVWNLINAASLIGDALGKSFTDAGGAVKGLIGDLMQLAKSILMVAIAEHIKNSTSSVMNWLTSGTWGAVTAVAGVAAITAAWNSIKLADGGIAYGETLATIGEYPGARSNPEVIAPLSDLKNIIGETSGVGGEVRFVIEEDKLVGILNRHNKKQIYF